MNKQLLYLLSVVFVSGLASCTSAPLIDTPVFDYPTLLETYFDKNPGGHFAIIDEKGMNTDPTLSANGFLFYASDVLGSPDIWMRQLQSTVKVPVVEQDAIQNSPAVSIDGSLLSYVNYDSDSQGDIFLMKITPERIARDVLLGNSLNLTSPISVSTYIKDIFADDALCNGDSAELDPAFSIDKKYIYYSSDRCNERGQFQIWQLALNEDGRPTGKPERLMPNYQAIQANLSANFLVATALNNNKRPNGFLVLSLTDHNIKYIPYQRPGIALKPLLSTDESQIFYLAVARDTNGDGRIDLNDNGAVQSLSISTGLSRFITDASMPMYSIGLWPFREGGILYVGYDQTVGRSRIYLSKPQGLIPKKKSITEQYEFIEEFSGGRKQLALESIIEYFGDDPAYFLFEYDVLSKLANGRVYHNDNNNVESDQTIYQKKLAKSIENNRFSPVAKVASIGTTNALEAALKMNQLNQLDPEKKKMAVSFLRERLANNYLKLGQLRATLSVLEQLNHDNESYFNRDQTLLLEAKLQVRLTGKISDRFRNLLSNETVLKQQLLQAFYSEYSGGYGLNLPDPNNETLPLLKGLFMILKGEHLFRLHRYTQAKDQIQEGLKFTGDANLGYAIGWKLLASIYDIEQKNQLALDARLRFLRVYKKDWNLDVDESDFVKLIDASRRYIEDYKDSARSIAEDVEARLDYRLFLIDEIKTTVTTEQIQLNMVDRDLLIQFCSPGSTAGLFIQQLGYKNYVERYVSLCASVNPYLTGNTRSVSLEEAHEISELFYMVSYANATLINILFLEFRMAGLFDDLHSKWSVYYHRWKTDLAIERLNRNLVWEEKRNRVISPDTVQSLFIEKDPFDARIFNEILVGYKLAEENGRRYFDHSMLYGRAYLLLRKSEEREKFYDSLIEQGVQIPSSVLTERKKSILDDLKQAEYRLLYILNVDPNFMDATLLLSWLYQYIDNRKEVPVPQDRGFLDQIVNILTQTPSPMVKDRIYYRSLYQHTFNRRYYEENVDLLSNAIERINRNNTNNIDSEKSKEANLALLYLNLANNHFQLVNYTGAANAYDQVDSLIQKHKIKIFENNMQHVLFYLNRGRARFYSGQSSLAALDFTDAVKLLEASDYWPAFEAANASRYKALSDTKNTYLKARNDRRQSEFLKSRYRLALLQALRGLAFHDAGDSKNAVNSYAESLHILYSGDVILKESIDKAGLENYIAMALQELENYDQSNLVATIAAQSAEDAGLDRFDFRFQPQTLGGRVLGLLIGYGEDFSVIGEGRTPFGFSPLRQYELSLGIRFSNAMKQGDLEQATEVLAKRIQIFKKKDNDVRLGREGQIYSLNQMAEIELSQGQYRLAFDNYRKAADEAYSAGLLNSYRTNFHNSYMVLFSEAQSTNWAMLSTSSIQKRMKHGLSDLIDFRDDYGKALKEAYIKERLTEDSEYSFSEEKDQPIIEKTVARDLADFSAIEGLVSYYLYILQNRSNSTVDGNLLDQAEQRLRSATDIDKGVTTLLAIRSRLNLSRILLEKRDFDELKICLDKIDEETFEFNAIPERFEYYHLKADFLWQQSMYQQALAELLQADSLIKNHLYLLPLIADRLDSTYERISELQLHLNRPLQAVAYLEDLRQLKLQLEFYRFALEFSNKEATELHRIVRMNRRSLRRLQLEETELRLSRKDTNLILKEIAKQRQILASYEVNLKQAVPHLADFITLSKFIPPVKSDPQQYLRLIKTSQKSHCIRFFQGEIFDSNFEDCSFSKETRSVIVADVGSVIDGSLNKLLKQVGSRRVLRTTLRDFSAVYIDDPRFDNSGLNIFNIKRTGPAVDLNYISIASVTDSHIFERRQNQAFSPLSYLRQPHFSALAEIQSPFDISNIVVDNDQIAELRRWWIGMNYAYDVFRAFGGGIFLLHNKPYTLEPEEFGVHNTIAFGTQGFDRKALEPYLIEKSNQALRNGLAKLQSDRVAALNQFMLADSYLEGLDNEPQLGSKARVYLARSLTLLNPDQGNQYFENQLKIEKGRLERYALYRSWISSLAANRRFKEALSIYSLSLAEFPEQETKKANEKAILNFLNELNQVNPSASINQIEVLMLLLQSEKSFKPVAADLLYQHGNLTAAESILSDQSLSSDNMVTRARVMIEQALLKGDGIDESLSYLSQLPLSTEDFDLTLILNSYQKRWEYQNSLLQLVSPQMSHSALDQRRLLYRQLRSRIELNESGLESLTCIVRRPSKSLNYNLNLNSLVSSISNSISTSWVGLKDLLQPLSETKEIQACGELTETEQLLQFRMALDSISFDGHGQVESVIQELINVVKRKSTLRAGLYSLIAAEAFLLDERVDEANKFFIQYSDLMTDLQPSATYSQTEAFVTIWLHAFGVKVPELFMKRSIKNQFGDSLFQAIQPFSNAKNLKPEMLLQFSTIIDRQPFTWRDKKLGLILLKKRAEQQNLPKLYFDLIVAQKRFLQRRKDWGFTAGLSNQFQQKIPAEQSLFVLDDSGIEFRRIEITKSQFNLVNSGIASASLRSRLINYFQNQRHRESAATLSDEYNSLMASSNSGISYWWLTGVHSLAPVALQKNEYQVLDPEQLLVSNDNIKRGLGPNIRVVLNTLPSHDPAHQLYRNTMQQLTDWTNFELQQLGYFGNQTITLQEGWKGLPLPPNWFLFEELPRPTTNLTPGNRSRIGFNYGIPNSENYLNGSGIISRLAIGSFDLVPKFIKALIKSDLPVTSLRERYDYGQQQIQDIERSDYLFFKPIATSFQLNQ